MSKCVIHAWACDIVSYSIWKLGFSDVELEASKLFIYLKEGFKVKVLEWKWNSEANRLPSGKACPKSRR